MLPYQPRSVEHASHMIRVVWHDPVTGRGQRSWIHWGPTTEAERNAEAYAQTQRNIGRRVVSVDVAQEPRP